MAYVPQQIPEEEQNKFANPNQTTPNPAPPQVGGSAGTGSGGPTAPGVGSSTQFGSNAAKLSDYLAANKDQAGQFGQQVAGNLTKGYNDAMGSIDQGVQQFGQQVGQGYTPYDATTVNKAATDPSGFVKDPDNVQKFKSIYNDQYSGPQNFEGSGFYSGVNDQVNKAVENAGLTKTSAGLGTYLNNMGANDTTEGMRTLDTALLMGNKESSQAIRDAAAPYQNLGSYLSGQTQNANAGVQNAKQAADTARQNAQGQFTGANGVIPTFQNDLTGRVNAARSTASDKTAKDIADLKAGTATPQELADFGIDPNQFQGLSTQMSALSRDFGNKFDLSNYFTPQNAQTAITPETLGSADDFARAAALSQLTGTDMSSVLNPANSSMAGTAPSILSSFDLGKAAPEVSNQLQAADVNAIQQNQNPGANADPHLVDIFGRNKNMLNNAQMAWWLKQVGLPGGSVVGSPSGPGSYQAGPGSTPIGSGGINGSV